MKVNSRIKNMKLFFYEILINIFTLFMYISKIDIIKIQHGIHLLALPVPICWLQVIKS